jgi:hypothetical protein
MTENIEQLEATLADRRGERAGVESVMTKEDLARAADSWLVAARAHAAGSSRLVLGGQASAEHLAAVLHEDRLDDVGLAGRIVARLERQGFGELSDRQRGSKLKALDSAIVAAEQELLAARKQEALEQVERQFAA